MVVFSSLARFFGAGTPFFCTALLLAQSCVLAQSCGATEPLVLDLSWSSSSKEIAGLDQLPSFLSGQRLVSQATFKGDVFLDEDELRYVTGSEQGATIDAVKVINVFAALVCSKRFVTIELRIKKEADGLFLQWYFEGRWRFDRLKIHGLLVGKDWYAQLYQAEAGMTFDEELHEKHLTSMMNAFHDYGYFDAHVASRLDKDSRRKLYVVNLWPKKGAHYTFGRVEGSVEPYEHVSEAALSDVRSFVTIFLKKRLEGGLYSRTYLNAVAADLKQEMSLKGFLQTSISLSESIRRNAKAVDVLFTIKVGQCKRIVFFGNTFFSTKQLFERLLLFGQSVLLLPCSVLADEILLQYKDKGFFNAKVEVVEEREAFFFVISEGKRLSVEPLNPVGVSDENRHSVMRIASRFSALQWFDAGALSRTIDSLHEWYAFNGYLSCLIEVSEPELSNEGVRIAVKIVEGECLKVSSVRLVFEEGCSLAVDLEKRLKQDIGKPLSPQLLDEQRRYMQSVLREQGYLHAHFVLERQEGAVEWRIFDVKTKTHVGPVILAGTTKMPFKRLERLINKQQGLVWRQEVIKSLFNELKQTDVFSAIHIDPIGKNSTDDRPLCLTLHDDDPFELRLRAGAALEHVSKHVSISGVTYRAGGTLFIKNPFNRADNIRIEADVAGTQRTFELGYSQPWFLGSSVRYEGLAYSHLYDQPAFLGSKQTLYTMFQHGVLSSFHRKKDSWDAGVSFGFEWDKTSLPDHSPETKKYLAAVGRALRFEPSMLGRGVPYIFVEPTLMISTLDNALQPTKGGFTLGVIKGMVPVGGIPLAESFVRLSFEQAFFVPIGKLVTAFRFRCGHIFNKKFERIMPVERFYLGGANSVRGYETDFTPPLGRYCDNKGASQVVPQGGRSMVNINLELRFPLVGSLGGVLFQDFGALHDSLVAYVHAKDMAAASGFGLRYQTPVGPLRFDAAWRWGSSSLPLRRFVWFLGFGSAF